MSGEEFKCENCGLSFSTQEDLEEHMKQHKRAAELFRCEKCKMSFPVQGRFGEAYARAARKVVELRDSL